LGSPNLTASLMQIGLIDELRIMVNPVVLGTGKSVFNSANERSA
jgi:dihydrofolate reductase